MPAICHSFPVAKKSPPPLTNLARKQRLRLKGYGVLGGERALLDLIEENSVDVVVVSARRFDDVRLKRVERACRRKKVNLMRFTFHLEPLVAVPTQAIARP